MRCCDVEALWDEMRGGVEPEREQVLAHLRRCTTCQHVYEQYEGVAYCLTCLPIVEPPQNLVPRILDHINSMRQHFRSAVADEFASVGSPLGNLFIAWRGKRITFVGIGRGEDAATARALAEKRLSRPVRVVTAPTWVSEAVRRFFVSWQVDFELVDISELSDFEQAALHKAAQIPPGQTRSYGWIAREIGHPAAARAVGGVMARNPVALLFPCHRVVDSTGALHGYGYGVEIKARILAMEGYDARASVVPPQRAKRAEGNRSLRVN